jgi:hypothetical protein
MNDTWILAVIRRTMAMVFGDSLLKYLCVQIRGIIVSRDATDRYTDTYLMIINIWMVCTSV